MKGELVSTDGVSGADSIESTRYGELHSPIGRVVATAVQRSTGRVPTTGFRLLGAYAFVMLLAGNGRYQDEMGTNGKVSAGDVMMIFPSVKHAYGPEQGSSWVERYVVFDGPIFGLWHEASLLDPRRPIIHLNDVNAWNDRIDHIFGESGTIGTLPALEEVCRLQLFLARIQGAVSTDKALTSEDRAWLSAARALLGTSGPEGGSPPSLPSIAAHLSLSYDGFRKRFRRLTGISPGRYRSLHQIDQARAMIQAGTMTDRAIAEALGFHDASHFSRRFKQVMGRSPREFRAALPGSLG